ncbi:hypothetical protein [Mesorhizobium sp. WSM4312]|uniref:hypothetical protein n=1 Tax=Mesorhizobium sp. WSM4312 TaxID=2029411 RepID=UPI0015CBC3B2|nr:hypothetical protein [Mesorhizobium sp. WSM4312]
MIGGEAQPGGLSALCPARQRRRSRSIAKASTTGAPVVKAGPDGIHAKQGHGVLD